MTRLLRAAPVMLLSALALAGCSAGTGTVGGGGGLGALFSASGNSRGAAIPVMDGAVKLAAPSGFCADPTATRSSATSAFILYGACRAIEGRGPKPAAPAILTAAVSPAPGELGPEAMAALADYVQTDAGEPALSRTDNGSEVEVESLDRAGDLVLVRARDGAGGDIAPAFWRVIFPQSGTLVTVTVSNMAATPVTSAQGKALAIDFVAAIRAANAGDQAPAPANESTPDPEAEETAPGGLRAFFKRLL